MLASADHRLSLCKRWAEAQLGGELAWADVSVDASTRRYFRTWRADDAARRWIVVDAPPDSQDSQAFVDIAALFQAAGLHVPRVRAADIERGLLLLSDLGDIRYIDRLHPDNADALFSVAIDALVDWQAASRPGVLPAYDRATLWREIRLFDQWYLPHVLGETPDADQIQALTRAYTFIIDRMSAQAPVFVHRDYMPRNLMVCEPLPGILDFQDARYGPASYDVASLFMDAFISWPAERVAGWQHDYWQAAHARGIPVAADWPTFQTDVALSGAQRHLKIMGLFVRLAYQQGKHAYAADLGRFAGYLAPVVNAHAALAPLRAPIAAALAHHETRP
ncbi:phosphotransferase [uncultured Salinisphaera sp.]|uniref:aminoglycoside phosphotransferase family protein n=1 Tax=uncultured Salinisphaera sp. TaxID=359372 RepID=UPI0032B1C82F|tara:strand:- start:2480 stop:3484 length:1005 start_codon:yes stop_codon:yes gene_type:complete